MPDAYTCHVPEHFLIDLQDATDFAHGLEGLDYED